MFFLHGDLYIVRGGSSGFTVLGSGHMQLEEAIMEWKIHLDIGLKIHLSCTLSRHL